MALAWTRGRCGGTATAQIDPRVGGRFHIDMMGQGQTFPHDGEYLRLERPRLIEFTWISKGTNQQRSVVSVELRSGGRKLRRVHVMHPATTPRSC
jgi:uncharacterized protein YndB with AHSA1/START domain